MYSEERLTIYSHVKRKKEPRGWERFSSGSKFQQRSWN